ncbi:MAG: hypothetical protein KAX49_13925 [Halanaerobiales bacterium]|nr:hypothetical protein [Halanaerobiales bacterium]
MAQNKRQIAENLMVDLLSEIADNLLEKVRAGDATHQDISNAIKLLNNNGITVAVNKGQPLGVLQESLPFHSDHIA